VRFPRETFDYYRSLEPPVLIVRYHAATDALYVRWVYSFDPYYGGASEKSINLTFAEEDRWVASTPERLRAELDAYRRFKAPEIPLPVRFYVELAAPVFDGWDLSRHVIELRRAASPISNLLVFDRGPSPFGGAWLRLARNEMTASFSGIKSFSIHDLPESAGLPSSERFTYDALVIVAVAFSFLGQPDLSARVAEIAVPRASVSTDPQVALLLAAAFARARRVSEALRVAESFYDRSFDEGDQADDHRAAAAFFSMAPLAQLGDLSESVRADVRRFHDRMIEGAARVGPGSRASAHYNLANHLLTRLHDEREAFHHYRLALRHDPSYCDREYFCSELAGCLFEAGRPRLSAVFYRRALDLGGGDDLHALLADALMADGRLAEASAEFATYCELAPAPKAEWRLKVWMLEQLRARAGDHPIRDSASATTLRERALEDEDPRAREASLLRALDADVLDGTAWFNLGVLYWGQERFDESLLSFLIAAGIIRHDPESWRNVIPFCWFSDRENAGQMLAGLTAAELYDVAWNLNGHRITETLVDGFGTLDDSALRSEAFEWLEAQEARQSSGRGGGFTLRFPGVGPEATFHIVPPEVNGGH
jgi:tetratricopeptide (TPR) repeat protein